VTYLNIHNTEINPVFIQPLFMPLYHTEYRRCIEHISTWSCNLTSCSSGQQAGKPGPVYQLYLFPSSNYSDITLKLSHFLRIKPTRCTNSQIYFWNRTLHVSDRFSVHHQGSSTVHTAIGICHTGFADYLLAGSGWNILIPLASSQHNLYDIYLLLCVQC